jgi:hypothetical protein
MALKNCTINSSSVDVTPSQILGSGTADQVLTITPNTGFRVAATNFTDNSGSLTGVEDIVLTNSGTPYAANNTIIVTVDLDNAFNPGTSHHTITIDIDGDATNEKNIPVTLAGTYTVDGSNITQSDETNVAYSVEGSTGITQDIISKTVTASSGNYFATEPTISITGSLDDYSITTTISNDGSGNLNSKVFDIDGIIPLEDVAGDTIYITAKAETVPVDTNRINSYSFNTSGWSYNLTKRPFKAYGDIDATFKLTIVRSSDNYTYDFSTFDFTELPTNSGTLTIANTGQYSTLLIFPPVTADITYTFTIAEVDPSTLNISQTNPFTVDRKGFTNVTVNAVSDSRGTFQSKTIAYTDYAGATITQAGGTNATYGQAGTEIEGDSSEFNFSIIVDDDQAFQFSGAGKLFNSITLDSSAYSSTGNAEIAEGTTTAARAADSGSNANQLLTITGTDWFNYKYSELVNHVVTFNVDSFCDDGGGGSPGSDTLEIGLTRFLLSSGGTYVLPNSYSQTVTGRQTGSTTIVYEFRNVVFTYPDVPSYVDYPSDIGPPSSPITATSLSPTTAKLTPSSLSPAQSSYTITNMSHTISSGGTTNVSISSDFDVTITNFSPAIATNDHVRLLITYTFADINQ